MPNPDRLTGLDSSFLHLERDSAHMHVAGCIGVRGPRARVLRSSSTRSSPGCISCPATGSGSRSCRSSRADRSGSTTRTSRSPSTSATRRCRGPEANEQLKRLAGRVFSQALDRSRPLWELWLVEGLDGRPLRAALEDPPRARRRRLRRRHRDRAVRHLPGPGAGRSADHEWAPAAAADRAPAARRRAARARDRSGRDRPRRPRGAARPAAGGADRVGTALVGRRRDGVGGAERRAREPVQRADRPAPPVHLGRRRPAAEFKAIKNALGGTVNDVGAGGGRRRPGPLHAPARLRHRRRRAEGDGARSRSAPTSSAARSATASRRCGRRCRSASPIRSSGC